MDAGQDGSRAIERTITLGLAHGAAGRLETAVQYLNEAEEQGGDPILIEGAVGMAHIVAGRIVEAEWILLRTLIREPELTGALYNLGTIRAKQGGLEESAALVRTSWNLGERDPKHLARDPDLAPIVEAGLLDDLLADEDAAHCATW